MVFIVWKNCKSVFGRFLTVKDKKVEKGKVMKQVADLFHDLWGKKILTVHIGDCQSEESLFRAADRIALMKYCTLNNIS